MYPYRRRDRKYLSERDVNDYTCTSTDNRTSTVIPETMDAPSTSTNVYRRPVYHYFLLQNDYSLATS